MFGVSKPGTNVRRSHRTSEQPVSPSGSVHRSSAHNSKAVVFGVAGPRKQSKNPEVPRPDPPHEPRQWCSELRDLGHHHRDTQIRCMREWLRRHQPHRFHHFFNSRASSLFLLIVQVASHVPTAWAIFQTTLVCGLLSFRLE